MKRKNRELDPVDRQSVIAVLERWVEKVVIGLDFCPFAARVVREQTLHWVVSENRSTDLLLEDFYRVLLNLNASDSERFETCILAMPCALKSFEEYLEFVELANLLIDQNGWRGCYQLASFHPDYCFAGSHPEDRSNYTNRSPYPLLHILREAGISRALAGYADPESISARNILTLENLRDDQFLSLTNCVFHSLDGQDE